jgi:hypothetical protein
VLALIDYQEMKQPKRKAKKAKQISPPWPAADPEIEKLLRPSIPVWLDDAKLSASEFRVFCRVLRRASGKNGRGCCHEAVPNIAKGCRLSHNTVRKSLRRLVELGFLQKKEKYKLRSRQADRYRVVPTKKDWISPQRTPEIPF